MVKYLTSEECDRMSSYELEKFALRSPDLFCEIASKSDNVKYSGCLGYAQR